MYCPDILTVNEILSVLCPTEGVGSTTFGMTVEEVVCVTTHWSLSVL